MLIKVHIKLWQFLKEINKNPKLNRDLYSTRYNRQQRPDLYDLIIMLSKLVISLDKVIIIYFLQFYIRRN